MLSRRTFVKSIAAAGALTAIFPDELIASPITKQIGIQLYTIRDLVQKDLVGTLYKLAEIGYRTIETAGYQDGKFYGHPPVEFKKLVNGIGLNPLSSHSGLTLDNIDKSIADASDAGMKYLVLPSIPGDKRKTLDDYKKIADDLNKMGEKCKNAGIIFGYHNHAFEFQKMENELPYDLLLENTEADLVTMQLDTYWMIYGGYEPVDYFKKFPGRFKLWHVKDMVDDPSKESTEIGNGIVDFPSIFKLRKKAGMEYIFLEQEEFKMDTWDSLKISFQYLNQLNF